MGRWGPSAECSSKLKAAAPLSTKRRPSREAVFLLALLSTVRAAVRSVGAVPERSSRHRPMRAKGRRQGHASRPSSECRRRAYRRWTKVSRLAGRPVNQSAGRVVGHSSGRSVGPSVLNFSVTAARSVGWVLCQPVNQSLPSANHGRSIGRSPRWVRQVRRRRSRQPRRRATAARAGARS